MQVDVEGNDEIARLGIGFNQMVQTLDAQSRTLVDLQTMSGWREMARTLAHEVKNPLTPIQLTVEEMLGSNLYRLFGNYGHCSSVCAVESRMLSRGWRCAGPAL